MEPFAHRGGRTNLLHLLNEPLLRWLTGHQGVADRSKITTAEVEAYLDLLRRHDRTADPGPLEAFEGAVSSAFPG